MSHTLINALEPVFILGTLGGALYLVIKVFTDYILKKKMIEKGYVNDENQAIFSKKLEKSNKMSSLKWGLVVLFAGMALILLEYIPYSHESTFPFGLLAVFIATGFLLYYFIVKGSVDEE